MNRIISLLLVFALSVLSISADVSESKGTVTGTVVSEDGQPVDGAYIFIIDDVATQNIIASAISDSDGSFMLESPCGNMDLGISCLGYDMARYNISVKNNEPLDLGACQLKTNVQELQTVVVKGHPIKVKSKPDGFSVNVQELARSSNNALDLLSRLPQIVVKGNELKVVGKEQILLQVNNVLQRVDSDQLADVLRGYDASLIKSVDVITSPALKYDAEGTTAMIILHMDSKFNKYTGGNIGTELMKGAGYNGRYGIYGSGVFNNDKLFVNITPAYNHNYSYMTEKATYVYDDGATYVNNTPSKGKNDYFGGFATVQYQYNSKGYIGLNCNVNKRNTDNNFISEEIYSDEKTYDRNLIDITRPRINASIYVEHSFSPKLKSWFEVSYYNYKEQTDLSLDGSHELNQNPFMNYISNQDLKLNGLTFSNDYSLMFDNNGMYNLDFGLKAYYASTLNKRWDELTYDDGYCNNQDDKIKLDEIKLIPYISTTLRPSSSLFFRIGTQLSYTDRNVKNELLNKSDINYINFLPDFIASWSNPRGSRLSFIITSACIEPKFNQINPFEWRINQNSYTVGNMDLKSESQYNYKIVYTHGGFLSVSCYINQKRNEISSVSVLNDGKVYSIMENAQNSVEYGIRPLYYYDRLKWLEFSAEMFWGYKNSKGKIPGILKKATSNIWGGNIYAGFVFNKQRTITGYLTFDYTGRQKNTISIIDPICDFGAGVTMFFLNRKLSVSLAGMSLFASSYKGKSTRDGYSITFNNRYNYPTVYLSLSYKFNNIKDSSPNRRKMMRNIDRRM